MTTPPITDNFDPPPHAETEAAIDEHLTDPNAMPDERAQMIREYEAKTGRPWPTPGSAEAAIDEHLTDPNAMPATADEEAGAPPVDFDRLHRIGLATALRDLKNPLAQVEQFDPDLFPIMLEALKSEQTRARLAGEDEVVDALEVDRQIIDAVGRFKVKLKQIGERAQARQRLLSPDAGPLDPQAIPPGIPR